MKWCNSKEQILTNPFQILQNRIKDNLRQGRGIKIVNIRILYPHHGDNEFLNLSDLFCFLLYHSILRHKHNLKRRYAIGEVCMDRQSEGDNKFNVWADIINPVCIVMMILSSEDIDETSHETYYEELIKCKEVIENKSKSAQMFFPIFLCDMEQLSQIGKYFRNLAKNNVVNYLPHVLNYSLDCNLNSYIDGLWHKVAKQLPDLREGIQCFIH